MKKLAGLFFLLWSSLAQAGVPCTLPFTLTNGTLADATQVMANYNALVTCLTNAAASGANNDITSLLALTTPIPASGGGSTVYLGGTSTGTANAQVVASPTPTGFTLTQGYTVVFISGFTNTGPTTLAVNGTAATNIFRQTPSGPQAMAGGEIIVGQLIWATYDGTQFEMVSNGPQFGGYGPLVALASAGTVDLGTVPTHNITISGTTGITSFGATANLTFPVYKLTFSSTLTITYNATSLITPGTQNIVTQPNDTAEALYLGSGNWQIVNYTKANGTAFNTPTPLCGFTGLSIANGASNSVIAWAFKASVLTNPTGNITVYSTAQSGNINITTGNVSSALGGMDGEAPGVNNFLFLYAISNGAAWSGIASLNATAPSLAGLAGYVYVCRMGAMKVNGSSNLYGTQILGNEARYVVGGANLASQLPASALGASGTNCATGAPTYTPIGAIGNSGTGAWFPGTAAAVDLVAFNFLNGATGGTVDVAPNNSYGGVSGGAPTNPPPLGLSATMPGSILGRFVVESNNYYYCSANASGAVFAYGWKDAVNAN